MIALVAYLWRIALTSQRWTAPLIFYLGAVGVLSATTGELLPSYAGVAVALFFVSIWWTVLALNAEEAEQVPVTVTSAGSFARVRLAKLTVAYLGSVLLGLVGLAGPALASPSGATAAQIGAGAGAFLITALAGTAIGGFCARPVVQRTAWAVLLGVLLGMADVLVPYGPPSRQVLVLLNGSVRLWLLGPIAIETVLLASLALLASVRLAWSRS